MVISLRWLACIALLVLPGLAQAEDGFVPLFNGKDFEGWKQKGGKAVYTIEGDEIVGTSVPKTENSFLCTARDYGDFILELEFKVDPLLNSGIQFRSQVFDEPKTYEVKDEKTGEVTKKTVAAGRVHGYQCEIDPSPRAWSAGIYDESRRGWLVSLTGEEHAAAQKAFKQNEWNKVRIECNGNRIKTFLNGVPASDLTDDWNPSGLIALQVHGVGNDASKIGKQVRWKNVRIKELNKGAAIPAGKQWVQYQGQKGPGLGKHVVLISGDEEYRSEEALPQLAKILAERHGFKCTVLFAIDPATGFINPNVRNNIPGLENLKDADLMILFTRFRELPDDQMKQIDDYLKSGRPVIGLRTATHAFKFKEPGPWDHYSNDHRGPDKTWNDGFGRLVLGEKWVNHHGTHRHESTRTTVAPEAEKDPILSGIPNGEIWTSTDVYGVRTPLPEGTRPLLLGHVIKREGEYQPEDRFFGMRPTDSKQVADKEVMPVVWTRTYQLPGGKPGRALTSTLGSSTDFLDEGLRRLLVNAAYDLTGLTSLIPSTGTDVDIVGVYEPTQYGSFATKEWTERGLTVSQVQAN
ncbi:family 16 glycoside hydrolase [Planctomicrobium sp. SH664]|uniref:family 16 glycoside hydrolase n=1 Tax=Planctomicrobium sp. SH664 TaxID=3448125 RepID=UPI003F5BD6A3